jgi:hypothetical protein
MATKPKLGWTLIVKTPDEHCDTPPAAPDDDPTRISGYLPTTQEWLRICKAYRKLLARLEGEL